MKAANAQRQMFFHQFNLSPKKMHYLEKSWAGEFYNRMMPVLIQIQHTVKESDLNRFRIQTWEIAEILGVMLLKHHFNLTDIESADHYNFDLRWQKALGLSSYDCLISPAIVSEGLRTFFYSEILQKNLRQGLSEIAKGNKIIAGYECFDLVVLENRIFNLGWSRLVFRTISLFLMQFDKRVAGGPSSELSPSTVARYMGKTKEYEDSRPSESFMLLKKFLTDMQQIVNRFKQNESINQMKSYQLLNQLNEELAIIFSDIKENI